MISPFNWIIKFFSKIAPLMYPALTDYRAYQKQLISMWSSTRGDIVVRVCNEYAVTPEGIYAKGRIIEEGTPEDFKRCLLENVTPISEEGWTGTCMFGTEQLQQLLKSTAWFTTTIQT